MNDLQLDYFLAAARNLSFSKAAQELYVSQPAVSRQIQALEEELGCPLFLRQNKGIQLTANGEMFYRFFDEYKSQLNDLKLRVRLSMEQKSRVVHFGILTNSNLSHIVNPVLEEFNQKYPDVKVEINSYEPRKASDAIQSGKEDVVLTIMPKVTHVEGLESETISEIPRVLIYNKRKYAEKISKKQVEYINQEDAEGNTKLVSPADFKDEDFLTVSDEEFDFVTELIRSICKPYGFVPKVQLVRSTDAMIGGVQCGLGVAINDIWCRALDNPDFGHIVLDTSHAVTLIWNQETDTVVKYFIKILKKNIK